MKLTPKGYMPRLIDKEIEENLKIFGKANGSSFV